MMKKMAVTLAVCALLTGLAVSAEAKCLNKAAVATSGSEKSAKWFALETMVQAVSWGLWPAFLADGSTPGYRITRQKYRCKKDGGAITCKGQATFCPTGKS
jgi:hypothetical protein